MEALKIVGDGKSQSKYCERVFSDFPQDIVSTSQYQVCVPASDLANWWPDEPEHGRMEELERSHAWRVCSKGCRGESAKPRVRAVSRSNHRSSCGVLELARTCVQMAVRWLQKDEIRDAQRRCSFILYICFLVLSLAYATNKYYNIFDFAAVLKREFHCFVIVTRDLNCL